MYNFDTQNYVAAAEVTYKFNDHIRMCIKLTVIFLKAIFLTLIESIKLLWKVVLPSEKKQVNGQLALVTGGANGLGREIARRS